MTVVWDSARWGEPAADAVLICGNSPGFAVVAAHPRPIGITLPSLMDGRGVAVRTGRRPGWTDWKELGKPFCSFLWGRTGTMNFAGMIRVLAVCLAVLGFCLPQPLLAAVQTDHTSAVTDVTMHRGPQGNVFAGRVLDQQGVPQGNIPVMLLASGQTLAETTTDRNGSFVFANLRGGVYQVVSTDAVGIYRVWMPGTAPPSAQPSALIIAGEDVVRGQFRPLRQGCAQARFWLSHPCVVAGLVATGVLVPVLLLNCDDDGPQSPP